MRKIIQVSIMLLVVTFGLLVAIPYNNTVKSVTTSYSFGFEDTVAGTQISAGLPVGSDNIFTSKQKSPATYLFQVSSSGQRTGSRCFIQQHDTYGWFNASYSKTKYLINFSAWNYWYSSNQYTIYFQNRTTGHTLVQISYMQFTEDFQYYDEIGSPVAFVGTHHYTDGYSHWGFQIIENGDAEYYFYNSVTGYYSDIGSTRNPTYIINGERIDVLYIYCYGGTGTGWIDDMTWKLSDSYGGTTGNYTYGGCLDKTGIEYYANGQTGIDTWDILDSQTEFTSFYDIDCLPYAFDLYVQQEQITFDSDLDNYTLYVNGFNVGSPICYYQYSGYVYVMEWDLTSMSEINNTPVVFELWHYSLSSNGNYDWYLMTTHDLDAPQDPNQVIYSGGFMDGAINPNSNVEGNSEYGAVWRLYYTQWQPTPPDEDITPSLNLIGFHDNHPLNNLPYLYEFETGFFEVFSNRTDGYYHLNISTIDGYNLLPVYSTHKYFGFTPDNSDFDQGYYNVSLQTNTETIVKIPFYVDSIENKTGYDNDSYYMLWTNPNPSGAGGSHEVGVFITNFSRYDYFAVAGFLYNQNSADFSSSWHTLHVTALDENNVWIGTANTFVTSGYEVWRLFGSADGVTYIPLIGEYKHYVSDITLETYIRTSLTNNQGYINEEFNIYGLHPYYLSRVAVFWNTKLIKDNIYTSFTFPFSYDKTGTYVLTMKLYNNGTWEQIGDNVLVKLLERQNDGGSPFDDVFRSVGQPMGSILGMIITIFCLLTPFIIGASIHLNTSIHPIIYAFTGGLGLSISTILGFFPVWIPLFVVVCGVIVIVIFYIRGTQLGSSGGE